MAAYFTCGCGSQKFCRVERIVVRVSTASNGWQDEEQLLTVEVEYLCTECGQDHTDEIERKRRAPEEGSTSRVPPILDSFWLAGVAEQAHTFMGLSLIGEREGAFSFRLAEPRHPR